MKSDKIGCELEYGRHLIMDDLHMHFDNDDHCGCVQDACL